MQLIGSDAETPRLALGLSGGGDSLALLYLLRETYPEIALHALIVDHGLRPESAEEAAFAARQAERVGAIPQILLWSDPRPGQAHAREARHRLLARAARQVGASILCLGHTLDDRIETLRMRAARSGPASSVVGPGLIDPSPLWPEGAGLVLARPLLSIRRAELRAYLTQLGARWMDDPSNEDARYERVRVRASQIDEAQENRLVAQSDAARKMADGVACKALTLISTGAEASGWGGYRLDPAAFARAPRDAALKAIETLVLAVSGSSIPADPATSAAFLTALGAGEAATGGGAHLTVSAWLGRDPGAAGRADGTSGAPALSLQAGEAGVFDGRWEVRAHERVDVSCLGRENSALAQAVPAVFRPSLGAIRDKTGTILALPGVNAISLCDVRWLGGLRIQARLLPLDVPTWFDVGRAALKLGARLAKRDEYSNIVS